MVERGDTGPWKTQDTVFVLSAVQRADAARFYHSRLDLLSPVRANPMPVRYGASGVAYRSQVGRPVHPSPDGLFPILPHRAPCRYPPRMHARQSLPWAVLHGPVRGSTYGLARSIGYRAGAPRHRFSMGRLLLPGRIAVPEKTMAARGRHFGGPCALRYIYLGNRCGLKGTGTCTGDLAQCSGYTSCRTNAMGA